MSHHAFNVVVGGCVRKKFLLEFWREVSIGFLCRVDSHGWLNCAHWFVLTSIFSSASTLSRDLLASSFRRVDQDVQLFLFRRLILHFCFSLVLVLLEILFTGLLLSLPHLFLFLSPRWILVVDLLLLVPIDCHDTIFGLNTLSKTITICECMHL